MNAVTHETRSHLMIRSAIARLESVMREMPQLEIPVEHHFAPGVYIRKIIIPAGAILTGKIHRFEHMNIVTGDIEIRTETGSNRLTGHHVFSSPPGTKRVGYALADTIWMTVHPSDETDPDKLEKLLTVESFEELNMLPEPDKRLT